MVPVSSALQAMRLQISVVVSQFIKGIRAESPSRGFQRELKLKNPLLGALEVVHIITASANKCVGVPGVTFYVGL